MNNINFQSPIKSEQFIWLAEYNNGENLHEFVRTPLGYIRKDFKEIKKDILEKFGIIGQGYFFNFTVNDGVFHILNRNIEISYYDINTDTEYKFTSQEENIYNDIIMYRTAENIFNPASGQSTDRIIEYSVGYKNKIKIKDVNFSITFKLHIPMDGNVYMTYKIVSDTYLNGEFRILKNGEVFETSKTDLNKNINKEFKWVVR